VISVEPLGAAGEAFRVVIEKRSAAPEALP
jgi:hypothetical protein